MTQKKQHKRKLRHTEYYDLQGTFDELYAGSKENQVFNNLIPLITCEENIKLAYRNIKRNTGSNTPGVDELTIRDIEKIPEDKFIQIVQKKLQWYKPKAVRRVEIPKPNGKMRPLGIPAMWDRIVQQCILQILEPICEAKFHERSNGFRPNRSCEHAIAQTYSMIQISHLYYVIDIDIKGFFDNVNHTKLIKQMWYLGIRDKKLLCIIREMLKAPIVHPDGKKEYPTKGTPQGGILSPLLSNVVLNELDWWVASQWETLPTKHKYADKIKCGIQKRDVTSANLRRASNLKEMYMVRYADDFKIFCRKRNDANKAFLAVKQWLAERLKLEINEEKSKVINVKRNHSEFLGFKIKAVPKGKKFVVKSDICDKAMERERDNLKQQIKHIANPANIDMEGIAINLFNSMVIGMHNYYQFATHVSKDCRDIAYPVYRTMVNRLKYKIKKEGDLCNLRYIRDRYGQSAQMRFVNGKPLVPVSYVQHKVPMWKRNVINKYTAEGRKEIHKNLGIDMTTLHALMRAKEVNRSIEYMDNRISRYAAQHGKCAITGLLLSLDEIHCHHIRPIKDGGTDKYDNLIIVHKSVHRLIHANTPELIAKYIRALNLDKKQIVKLNQLRQKAGLPKVV